MKMALSHGLNQTLTALQQLEDHWNEKLSLTPDHKYPLVPTDLVERNLVTRANYASENRSFGTFCSANVEHELNMLAREKNVENMNLWVEVFGAGLVRDLKWIERAIQIGFKVRIRDISTVAIENVKIRFAEDIKRGRVSIVQGEIRQTLLKVSIDPERTPVYFASQFFQILNRENMEHTLCLLGYFLTAVSQNQNTGCRARAYLVHPLPEDNQGLKVWSGLTLPGVLWGDSIPYSLEELRFALEQGPGTKKISLCVLGKHHYYHQCYSFLKIEEIAS